MRKRPSGIAVRLAAAVIPILVLTTLVGEPRPKPPPAPVGFHVDGGRLRDANETDFVMRGVGHAHTAHPDRTAGVLRDAKSLGANTVRIEVSTGAVHDRTEAADIARLVALCRENRLVCILVAHDTTGWGARFGAIPQARAVDYWLTVRDVLVGQEPYVIINIANEPYVLDNYQSWRGDTIASIHRMRAEGFRHTLMVDAPDWGQDRSFTMRDNAAAVFAADPAHNTVFSIHMYGAFDRAEKAAGYLNYYVAAGLPIVITEFGFLHVDGDVDEEAVIAAAQTHRLGYLGWSWSGNGGDVQYLDLVSDFDPTRLTKWGERLFRGPGGIVSTAREASVYAS